MIMKTVDEKDSSASQKKTVSLQKNRSSGEIGKKMNRGIHKINRSPIKADKLKKLKPAPVKGTKFYNKPRKMPGSLVAGANGVKAAGNVVSTAAAPLDAVSQAANIDTNKGGDVGSEALKLGVQTAAYTVKSAEAAKTAAYTTGKAVLTAGKAGAKVIDPAQRNKLVHKIKREFKGFKVSVGKTVRNSKKITYGILHLRNSAARAELKKAIGQGLKKTVKRNVRKMLTPSAEEVRRKRLNAKLKWYSREHKAPVDLTKKVFTTAAAPVKLVGKPVEIVKNQIQSANIDTSKSGDMGLEALKLAGQTSGYAEKALSSAATVIKTTGKGIQKSTKAISTVVDPYKRHHLKKRIKRSVKPFKQDLKKVANGTKKVVKSTAKAAKATSKAATQATKAASNAAKQAAKTTAQAIARVASFLTSTSPWSWIIIGILIIVLVISMLVSSITSVSGGSLTGGGGWVFDDEEQNTPEDVYENYKEYVEETRSVVSNKVKSSLTSTVEGFCEPVPANEPQRIISYYDIDSSYTFFPAPGGKTTITDEIADFKLTNEEYAEFLSLLFVVMTREKQTADEETDVTIYDFDFKREDIETLIGDVNINTCRWGSTYIYKTAVTTSPVACPGEACKKRYLSGCRDDYYYDDNGVKHYYCTGHPYCPINHTKMTVKLYTIEDYTQKDITEIYNMTDNEKIRYNASKAIIQALLDDYGGEGT